MRAAATMAIECPCCALMRCRCGDRAGLADGRPHASTSAWRALLDPCREMWPCRPARRGTVDLGIEAEVGGQLRRSSKRRMSPTVAMKVAATVTLTPGTLISRSTCGQDSVSTAMSRSTAAISVSRKSTWRSPRRRSALADRQLLFAQPRRPLTPNRSTWARGPSGTHQHRVDLVLDPRARANQLRAPREAATHRPDALVRGPDAVGSPAHSSLANALASRRSVFARAWRMPVSFGETTITRATCASRIRGDRPRVAGHLQRHPVTRIEALREQLQRVGPSLDPAADRSRPSATIATSQKSR